MLANRQMVVGVRIDRQAVAVERHAGRQAAHAVGIHMQHVAAVGVGGAGQQVDAVGRIVLRGRRSDRRGNRRLVVGAGDGHRYCLAGRGAAVAIINRHGILDGERFAFRQEIERTVCRRIGPCH